MTKTNRVFTSILFALFLACAAFGGGNAVFGAQFQTANFIVTASTPEFARRAAECAEENRVKLANQWLGTTLRNWSAPCPIKIKTGPNLGAGGETSFTFKDNEVFGWKMSIQGTEERVLDSVLPHEISHMILATYFRQPVPRWIDEGAATSTEANVERDNYRNMLIGFLKEHKGLPFNKMVNLKEYPQDLMPFYSQGFSVCEYLIAVGGHRRLVEFGRYGMMTGNWSEAAAKYYDYKDLSDLQVQWTAWISEWHNNGCPANLPVVAKVPDYRLDIYGREMGTLAEPDPTLVAGIPNSASAQIRGQAPSASPLPKSKGFINPLNSFVALPHKNPQKKPEAPRYHSLTEGVGTAAPKASPSADASLSPAPAPLESSSEPAVYQGTYGHKEDASDTARLAPPLTSDSRGVITESNQAVILR